MVSGYKVSETANRGVLWKKVLLKIFQYSQENSFARVSFLTKTLLWLFFIKKETLVQVFFCEFCEGFKGIFFTEHLRWLLLKFKRVALKGTLRLSHKNNITTFTFWDIMCTRDISSTCLQTSRNNWIN